jgi:phosphoribosylformylglycinamidine synthase
MGGSEFLKVIDDKVAGRPPALDWEAEKALQKCLVRASSAGLVTTAHDLSEGGLAVALAESCLQGGTGVHLELPGTLPPHVALFSESQSRALVSVPAERLADFEDIAAELDVPIHILGTTGGTSLEIKGMLKLSLDEMRAVYDTALERVIAGAHH